MKTIILVGLIALTGAHMSHAADCPEALNFKLPTIDGVEKNLCDYRGKVILIVNTASQCGYTDQYEGLEALNKKYSAKNFVVLGFSSNNFGGQEPGTNQEIKKFCSTKFNVTFDMFAKSDVRGDAKNPLFTYLTARRPGYAFDGEIKWNFNKFLLGRDGKILNRFGSSTDPLSKEMTAAIEKLL